MLSLVGWAVVASLIPVFAVAAGASPVRSIAEIRHENVVLQHFDLSCGAAALATILRYEHGEDVTERDVAIGLISRNIYIENPSVLRARQGFSLLDMKRYVQRLGYVGEALGSVSYKDLLRLVPAIVPVQLHGYNHFVVFRGTLGSSVLLADPAYGNRTMSRRRFVSAWINYQKFGRVAFVVKRRDGLIPPNRLAISAEDFPLLN